MEKLFFCFIKIFVCFLNFTGSSKDILGSIEKAIFFSFLSPFLETFNVAFVMLDPVLNQM